MDPTDAKLAFAAWVDALGSYETPIVRLPDLERTLRLARDEDDATEEERLAALARIRLLFGGE